VDVCVSVGKAGLVGGEQLAFLARPLPSRCGPRSGLALIGAVLRQLAASQVYLLQLTPARHTALTLLFKVLATVTVYRGHHRTPFFMPGIIFVFIMCIGII